MTITTHEPLTVTLGSSGVTPEDVVAVARHDAKVTIAQDALDAVAKVRAHIDDLAHSEVPAYGISTGFGALANRHIPNDLRTQLQKSLIRSHAAGHGPGRGTRGGPRHHVPARQDPRLRPHRRPARGPADHGGRAQRRHHPGGPRIRLAGLLRRPRPAVPLRPGPDGRRRSHRARTAYCTAARDGRPVAELLAAHGIEPVTLAEKEGPGARQRHRGHAGHAADGHRGHPPAAHDGGHHRRAQRRGAARHGPGVPARAARRAPAAPGPGRLRGQHAAGAVQLPDRRLAPGRRHQGPGRLLAALRTPGGRRRPRHRGPRRPGRLPRTRRRHRQPGGPAGRPGQLQRQLPRRPGGVRARLPGHRRRGPELHRRAPHRPDAGPGPFARAAGLPGRGPGRRLRAS